MDIVIGTAGWSIARASADAFPAGGSALERYARRFRGAEINSSFHRSHRASTWQRWAASVPEDFRFAAKLPKAITHQAKLVGAEALVESFLAEVAPLGPRLSILLVQLPPKLAFERGVAEPFLAGLAARTAARIACEPRHPSWFEEEPDRLLAALGVARVAADPAVVPAAAEPGGWQGLHYWRLHGSPVMYRSAYGVERLEAYARQMERGAAPETWCMFDNTASSAATGDALMLASLFEAADQRSARSSLSI
ncbi:DUF72 domain-containing protein [Sphingomonas parva]|uniref:DUF72 domain-containing protein n=1 Tax=Sphingomonas parva TaxID=2555898 RepID=A0A4Y8ZR96_9SPHN|nr:DUF72 domain-containing protein [Sphingomonas parva]TFI58550.1 DUF72 domain-containing protein [Sphingomonas parva]